MSGIVIALQDSLIPRYYPITMVIDSPSIRPGTGGEAIGSETFAELKLSCRYFSSQHQSPCMY